MLFWGTWPLNSWYHMLLSHIRQAHCPSSCSNLGQAHNFCKLLQLPSSSGLPYQDRAAAKIQAGGMGSSLRVLPQLHTNNYNSSTNYFHSGKICSMHREWTFYHSASNFGFFFKLLYRTSLQSFNIHIPFLLHPNNVSNSKTACLENGKWRTALSHSL